MKKILFITVIILLPFCIKAEENIFLKFGYADFSEIGEGNIVGITITRNKNFSLEIVPFWNDNEIQNLIIPVTLFFGKTLNRSIGFGGGIGYQILFRSIETPYGIDKRNYSGPLAMIRTHLSVGILKLEIGYQRAFLKSKGLLTRFGKTTKPGESINIIFPNPDNHPLSKNKIYLSGFTFCFGIRI
ncbi:hypothetical protein KKG58_02640 [Patescibacteria group bacterium]|nr:hypothetical protein [Patescibacteria group bacterium]